MQTSSSDTPPVRIKRERPDDDDVGVGANHSARSIRGNPNRHPHIRPVAADRPVPGSAAQDPSHHELMLQALIAQVQQLKEFDGSVQRVLNNHADHWRRQQNRIEQLEATVKRLTATSPRPVALSNTSVSRYNSRSRSTASTLIAPSLYSTHAGGGDEASQRAATRTDILDDESRKMMNEVQRLGTTLMQRVREKSDDPVAFLREVSELSLDSRKFIANESVDMCLQKWPDFDVAVHPDLSLQSKPSRPSNSRGTTTLTVPSMQGTSPASGGGLSTLTNPLR